MSRVGIVSIWDDQNLGNRLQNFALQRFLEDVGAQALTIRNSRGEAWDGWTGVGADLRSGRAKDALRRAGRVVRAGQIAAFDRQYIRSTPGWIDADAPPPELGDTCDVFIAGSDQIWNPLWRGTDLDFLTFAPPSKRTAYAASFGVSDITKSATADRYAALLREMRAISVREHDGADIVSHLVGRRPPVHVDPVMLLDVPQWQALTSRRRGCQDGVRRIVTYFLGRPSASRQQVVDAAVEFLGARVSSYKEPRDLRRYLAGPTQFVAEISAADLVLTDSFHAAAFAVLFGRPLAVVPRTGTSDMSSRLRTLMKTFSIPDDVLVEDPVGLRGAMTVEVPELRARLSHERDRTRAYLVEAVAS